MVVAVMVGVAQEAILEAIQVVILEEVPVTLITDQVEITLVILDTIKNFVSEVHIGEAACA